MYRLEEKFSNIESENQILRQQTFLKTPVKKMADHLPIAAAEVSLA